MVIQKYMTAVGREASLSAPMAAGGNVYSPPDLPEILSTPLLTS